jgi:hypothetical protein
MYIKDKLQILQLFVEIIFSALLNISSYNDNDTYYIFTFYLNKTQDSDFKENPSLV